MTIIVNGLGFGDETKGSITDFLSHHFSIKDIVRYNGGPQAAHNVHIESVHHTFAQFGSATFNQCRTILSRFMLIEPIRFLDEEDVLIKKGIVNPLDQVIISENCIIITPLHGLICRLKELSRDQRNGSVGIGIGEAVADSQSGFVLKAKDLFDLKQTKFILKWIWSSKIDLAEQLIESNPNNLAMKKLLQSFLEKFTIEDILLVYQLFFKKVSANILSDDIIEKIINQDDKIIFEGAQGTLLDQNFGFFPYVTRGNCTSINALSLINTHPYTIGLSRAYSTRHGHGPLPTESDLNLKDHDNHYNHWQGDFRFGWLDLVLLRYAIKVNQHVDSLGITCVDHLSEMKDIKICTHYYYRGDSLDAAHRCFVFDKAQPRNLLDLKESFSKEEVLATLADSTPIYQSFSSWGKISNLNHSSDLPEELKRYLNYIEEQTCVPVSLISYGPDRSEKLLIKEIVFGP